MHQLSQENQNKEKHLLQTLEETSTNNSFKYFVVEGILCTILLLYAEGKVALNQKKIAELLLAAKNSKMSAEDARRIKAEIGHSKREYAAVMEQREQVAKLVEKREMQKANLSAEVINSIMKPNKMSFNMFCLFLG